MNIIRGKYANLKRVMVFVFVWDFFLLICPGSNKNNIKKMKKI